MSELPSIVDGSQLQTVFSRGFTIHRYSTSRRNPKDKGRKEYWRTEKRLGGGSYGTVWLQKCVKGRLDANSELRAIKVIPTNKDRQTDWVRELETIMEFSHQTVCYPRDCFIFP